MPIAPIQSRLISVKETLGFNCSWFGTSSLSLSLYAVRNSFYCLAIESELLKNSPCFRSPSNLMPKPSNVGMRFFVFEYVMKDCC